jgi:uncharacterized protein (DUF736 family)
MASQAKRERNGGPAVTRGERQRDGGGTDVRTESRREDGRYEGELKTLSVRADIVIMPIGDKTSHNQPDYRVLSQGIEIGAGWNRIGQMSGKEYVSLSISAPELGSKTLYANLGRAAGQTDPDVYALIWNPQD